jgi:methylmalonyl-CoA mutase N-terminal domain/subunit
VSLTAQQPELNLVRTALEALAAVLGGAQSLHTNGMDEVLGLPTDRASRLALRTQQVIAQETGVPLVADPLGGSWLVEALTDELEARAEEVFAHIDRLGGGSMLEGVHAGIEEGWFQGRIADAAYAFESKVDRGERVIVGVNRFTGADDRPLEVLRIGPEAEQRQVRRLREVKAKRSPAAVDDALERLAADAAHPERNLMPSILDAVRAYATEGEVVDTLAGVFGRWREDAII